MIGTALIAKERARQIAEEGWSLAHDSHHSVEELARAGAAYLLGDRTTWPWQDDSFHPKGLLRNLERGAALAAAALDRYYIGEIIECIQKFMGDRLMAETGLDAIISDHLDEEGFLGLRGALGLRFEIPFFGDREKSFGALIETALEQIAARVK